MISKKPIIGKYILDSLSIGMYNDPLMLIREYIQNATDAIDECKKALKLQKYDAKIDINIQGRSRNLTIYDNGSGIPAKHAWNILHDIGNSKKRINENRGFRGIGRLGGLGYCDYLVFKTKYKSENILTTSTWDCNKLRNIIRLENRYDTYDVLSSIIDFDQRIYTGDPEEHFFEVRMMNLTGSRDILLNVPLIKSYVSAVAPVPFDKKRFSFADRIDSEIRSKIPNYETYKITINGEQIFKSYADKLIMRGDKKDHINGIEFVELKDNEQTLAVGWIAKTQLTGTISPHSNVDGIRVRKDNILVGDKDLLAGFYRENRFNNYLAGEIYAVDEQLVPNSRRDDFEDNSRKDDFYESFIKNIGLPVSKKIRQISVERSKNRLISRDLNVVRQARSISVEGYFADAQKKTVLNELTRLKNTASYIDDGFDGLILTINKSKHFLDSNGNSGKMKHRRLLKAIFEALYKDYEDKEKAVRIIRNIWDLTRSTLI